jgi:tetratricopeptide (TPR) repeat protein
MRLPSTLITVSLVLLVLPSAVVAQAADEVEDMRARRHYEAGTAYYEVGDYDSALRELERSYEISRRPPLLFNLYMTEERLGHFARAAERLERYLAEETEIPNRSALEQRLERLRERAAEVPPAEAAADPIVAPIAGASERVAPPSSEVPLLSITGFSVAGVGLVTFAVAGALVLSEDGRLGACAPICGPGEVATLDAATIAADVGLGVALVGAILGVVGLVVEGGGANTQSRATRGRAPLVVRF